MSNTTDLLLQQMKEARARIVEQGRALRVLVELSEHGRKQRARVLVLQGKVLWVTDDDGQITAGVAASQGGVKYPVSITLKTKESGAVQVRGHLCSCYDHGKAGACKHVLAAAGQWVLEKRREWYRLKEAEDALTEPQATVEAA